MSFNEGDTVNFEGKTGIVEGVVDQYPPEKEYPPYYYVRFLDDGTDRLCTLYPERSLVLVLKKITKFKDKNIDNII